MNPTDTQRPGRAHFTPASDLSEYLVDATQRTILFLETLHQRGNIYLDYRAKGKPPLLSFPYEVLLDAREFEEPCNYLLLKILPDDEHEIDPEKRPFIVVDPRAGHGPGIGGSKEYSQVGVALKAGHPCYFISFYPDPVPGQRLLDIAKAEMRFVEEVSNLHPKADKPCVIGNCQAGWAVAGLASLIPDSVGPIILSGAPLSYWAGADGKNPMRYSGGLLGGKWLASLTSDLGNGVFDGAHLVSNFENLNPANTLWSKQYNLYANVDSERERFLDFEKWWGGFFFMNAEEMEAIVSQLFIGNKLAGGITTPEGDEINLHNIRSPIVIFASEGDNITPPQQALNWIIDLYGHEDAIIDEGQVIVYMVHETIGHLGIFVSANVARKEHAELVNTLDMIDSLLPGLYEMIIDTKTDDMPLADLVPGDYVVRFEGRTIEDLRDMGDGREDEDLFAPMAAVSDINQTLYETFLRPWVQAISTEASAKLLRETQPIRLQRSLFSDLNPFMAMLPRWAEIVEQQRQPVSKNNPFLSLEKLASDNIIKALDNYRDWRDDSSTKAFKAIYGPFGLGPWFPQQQSSQEVRQDIHEQWKERHSNLLEEMEKGGFTEAVARILCIVIMEQRRVERRTRAMGKACMENHPRLKRLDDKARKALVHRQASLVWLDGERARKGLTKLLPKSQDRKEAMEIVEKALVAQIDEPAAQQALGEIRKLLKQPAASSVAKAVA